MARYLGLSLAPLIKSPCNWQDTPRISAIKKSARLTGSQLTATLLMTRGLKVVHLSTHLSLAEAVRYVKKDIIVSKSELALLP